MITVEDLLRAYQLAYDTWLDPEVNRDDPTLEYAAVIRKAVSVENDKLRELIGDMYTTIDGLKEKIAEFLPCTDFCPRWKSDCADSRDKDCWYEVRMHDLGIEVKTVSCESRDVHELEPFESVLKENDFLRLECDGLRELIRDMWQWMTRVAYDEVIMLCDMDRIEETIDKLGIEVE